MLCPRVSASSGVEHLAERWLIGMHRARARSLSLTPGDLKRAEALCLLAEKHIPAREPGQATAPPPAMKRHSNDKLDAPRSPRSPRSPAPPPPGLGEGPTGAAEREARGGAAVDGRCDEVAGAGVVAGDEGCVPGGEEAGGVGVGRWRESSDGDLSFEKDWDDTLPLSSLVKVSVRVWVCTCAYARMRAYLCAGVHACVRTPSRGYR